jgi:hypothetical protein
MAITKTSPKLFLGAQIPNVKVLSPKIDEIIDVVNALETEGTVVASGSQVGSNTPTINQPSGTITVGSVATAGLASRTVTLTNSFITADSKVFVSLGDYGGTGVPIVQKVTPAAGEVAIVIYNAHASVALSAAFDLDFFVVN